jgi:hypothetical protein
MQPFADATVQAKYQTYDPVMRARLLRLRELAFETAQTLGLGPPRESLKWGQASFTMQDGKGSTFRLDAVRNGGGKYALYFLCQTTLIGTFRDLYADRFSFEGNRAVIFEPEGEYDEADIVHCMALAMNYGRKRDFIRTMP